MTVVYNPNVGIIVTALRLQNTIVPAVLRKFEFYFLLVVNLGVSYIVKTGIFRPEEYHVELALNLTRITGALMTFFVVFYNGNVFSRYTKLYELTKNMNEHCLIVTSLFCKEVKDIHVVRKLARMVLAACFLFFFERTPDESPTAVGSISMEEWNQLVGLGLIEHDELMMLQKHCRELGKRAIPSFMILQWTMKLYRYRIDRMHDIDKAVYDLRKCQQEIIELLELPMPFQYFHIMNLMLMLNLCLWAYSLALEDSYIGNVIFLTVQIMFQGLRELSVALADPYGEDAVDFPLNEWMSELYVRVSSLVEDEWKMEDHVPKEQQPLPPLKPGVEVVDLMIDLKPHPAKPTRQMTNQSEGSRSPKGKKCRDLGDGAGAYVELPQHMFDGRREAV
eukprot:TRINITY_DN4906_c0_g1_i2.p1 TRINITY_DN4906_c0_g1~~TRINITY_DN4906_c0_g1_i2.p1  ORF type:complete len:392 (+),score=65.00 TRINITY_DN4906_c0_g1_i2:48-1223(+)